MIRRSAARRPAWRSRLASGQPQQPGGPEGRMPDLLELLKQGPVVCAEGYLFECERRGYLQAGAFVPEVVLDHPEVVEELHREFVHADNDVGGARAWRRSRVELRVIGKL